MSETFEQMAAEEEANNPEPHHVGKWVYKTVHFGWLSNEHNNFDDTLPFTYPQALCEMIPLHEVDGWEYHSLFNNCNALFRRLAKPATALDVNDFRQRFRVSMEQAKRHVAAGWRRGDPNPNGEPTDDED